jgi:hypothetical protein
MFRFLYNVPFEKASGVNRNHLEDGKLIHEIHFPLHFSLLELKNTLKPKI